MKCVFQKCFVYFLIVCAAISLVLGAGGGGGGGDSGGGSAGSSSKPFIKELVCSDRGSITFLRSQRLENLIFLNPDGNIVDSVEGTWEGDEYVSEEAIFNDKGIYILKDPDHGDKTVECPGLVFSCRLVKISIDECKRTDTELTAKFRLEKVQLGMLKMQFGQLIGKPLLYENSKTYSIELENLEINPLDDGYSMKLQDPPAISSLEISYPACTGRYYAYSTIPCVYNSIKQQEEKTGEDLKCSGYMDIKDRVRCRIDLRESEKNEYENFYPEECRATDEKYGSCLTRYQAVQSCWQVPNGEERLNCVRQKLDLREMKAEKESCSALLDTYSRKRCIETLRDKVYNVIKFRLYNLEEEAEKLMEQGKLNKEDVVNFVVNMEEYKLKFNNAQTKDERKSTILEARKDWVELMRKIK